MISMNLALSGRVRGCLGVAENGMNVIVEQCGEADLGDLATWRLGDLAALCADRPDALNPCIARLLSLCRSRAFAGLIVRSGKCGYCLPADPGVPLFRSACSPRKLEKST
jgi:hypothetical protein